jgi:peptide subunit release factor 1 (eRF1)
MSLLPLIDRLAAFESTGFPVVSLYLNAQPDEQGRDERRVFAFARKELDERVRSYPPRSADRESLEKDRERILAYLRDELRPSANGVALFACNGADGFFEAVQLDAPIEESELFIGEQPHVYPLARLNDQYPRYAAVLLDSNSARIFVFGTGGRVDEREIESPKTRGSSQGGWSQARYQRHRENVHLHHAKEVVDALERVVQDEDVDRVILAGDDVIVPLLRDQLPDALAQKVVDSVRLDVRTPEDEVLARTLDSLREQDARDDREKVGRLLDAYRAGGLAVVGVEATRVALEIGQVDELLISATPALVVPAAPLDASSGDDAAARAMSAAAAGGAEATATAAGVATPAAPDPGESAESAAAEELVTKARQTSATVTFIEDAALLADVGGVGAFLRYRIAGPRAPRRA